jgi:ribulose-phosphate 3-epimerase
MSSSFQIAASILAADFSRLGEQVAEAEAAGADFIHIDVMDGSFVPNISFGIPIVETVRKLTRLPLDVHLMIVQPERHVKSFVEAGADRLTVHLEVCPHLHRVVQQIREAGARPSIAINPHVPVLLTEDILPFVDMVLLMTVNPGYGGQAFIPESLGRIRRLQAMIQQLQRPVDIQVDGGIDERTTPQVVTAGANVLVAGTSVFRAPGGVQAGIDRLRNSVKRQ